MWNYRLVLNTKDGHWLPRLAEVFYNDNNEPQFYSQESILKNLYWALVQPLKDIFRYKPLRDTDMVPDKDTDKMFDFANIGKAHMLCVEKGKDTYYINLPQDMRDELGWEEDDKVVWDETEVCTDYGEYSGYCLTNESLEERMKNAE